MKLLRKIYSKQDEVIRDGVSLRDIKGDKSTSSLLYALPSGGSSILGSYYGERAAEKAADEGYSREDIIKIAKDKAKSVGSVGGAVGGAALGSLVGRKISKGKSGKTAVLGILGAGVGSLSGKYGATKGVEKNVSSKLRKRAEIENKMGIIRE